MVTRLAKGTPFLFAYSDFLLPCVHALQGYALASPCLGLGVARKPDAKGCHEIPCHGRTIPQAEHAAPAVLLSNHLVAKACHVGWRHAQGHGFDASRGKHCLPYGCLAVCPLYWNQNHIVACQGQDNTDVRSTPFVQLHVFAHNGAKASRLPHCHEGFGDRSQILCVHPAAGKGCFHVVPAPVLGNMTQKHRHAYGKARVLEVVKGILVGIRRGLCEAGRVRWHFPQIRSPHHNAWPVHIGVGGHVGVFAHGKPFPANP